MEIQFKKTVWERVELPSTMTEQEAIKLFEDYCGDTTTFNLHLTNEKMYNWENIPETETFVALDENDGKSTVELWEDGEQLLTNEFT